MLNKTEFTRLIKEFQFQVLFNELGWDNVKKDELISVNDEIYKLTAAAEKKGFMIFVCSPGKDGKIPDYNTRKKIDNKITKLYFEHLIIYADSKKSQQIWQLVIKEPNKPFVVRETEYFSDQYPELLFQKLKGLFFTIDDEDRISIVDVKSNVLQQFNVNAEKVTKKFYTEFKAQHTSFLKFIKGIETVVDKDWYASLMLNRLMFIYFIQKKGFLDKNINYLKDKLKETQKNRGKDKFYKSFYRNFLLTLFHQGLGSPDRTKKILSEIGLVPYLNGGLFDVHELETKYEEIQIDDKAFEKIFIFFDEYNWHLDTKIDASGKDINPDVIGYIFEKYINDRASMGAYYTKEDITEYISKNTIIPLLFNRTEVECKKAFNSESSLWKMLKDDPERYIYDAVKKGTKLELPDEIKEGLDTTKPGLLERRKNWNKPAPEEYALPTEIWREVVERRNRYFEIKKKIDNDEIRNINDFITYNLNMRQYAQDAVEEYEGFDFINAFYSAIKNITILDPTCGSGAFLFAALNILEPLYTACIQRMRSFISEDDKHSGKKYPQFRKVIEDIKVHPSEKYYIFKSIILNNLYGVDIMKEAVEIAKLRLFLKLVAEVEPDYKKENMGLEPLPDIDFNIRSGNTLVGFATKKDLDKGLSWDLDFGKHEEVVKQKVYDQIEKVSFAFKRYKEIQLSEGEINYKEFKNAKLFLKDNLIELNEKLNDYLGNDYGKMRRDADRFNKWLDDYKPFHWFAEFYEIMVQGGFDVIIGNPPYIEYSKIKSKYFIREYKTIECGNIYAFIIERCSHIINSYGKMGMIVQNSIVCTKRMLPIQKYMSERYDLYFSNYDDRPAKLFTGLHHMKGAIFIASKNTTELKKIYSTKFYRWYEDYRNFVFHDITYYELPSALIFQGHISKLSSTIHANILHNIYKHKPIYLSMAKSGKIVYCHRIASYFIKSTDFIPYFYNDQLGEKKSDDYKEYFVSSEEEKKILMSLLNSNIFYLYWHTLHDGYHCGKLNIEEYPFNFSINPHHFSLLTNLAKRISKDYHKNSKRKQTYYKQTGTVIYDEFYPKYSKNILDEVDKILAHHYNLTEEELDFIINYDIKYRMGKELEEED